MTRAQRLRALADVLSEVTSVAEQADFGHVAEAALDAALADLGGLAGLDELNRSLALARDAWEPYPHDTPAEMTEGLTAAVRYWRTVFEVACDERDALRADRDRLREALRDVTSVPLTADYDLRHRLHFEARTALRESEAVT